MTTAAQNDSIDPKGRFLLNQNFNSHREIEEFNKISPILVEIEIRRELAPGMKLYASRSNNSSIHEFETLNPCLKRPKPNDIDSLYLLFVQSGTVNVRYSGGSAIGDADVAILGTFRDMRSSEFSASYRANGISFTHQSLSHLNDALWGNDDRSLPTFSPTADMSAPGLKALHRTIRHVDEQGRSTDLHDDHTFSLIQEIIAYQLLSAWPTVSDPSRAKTQESRPTRFTTAIDYIEENIASPLKLADIAAAAGLSVRALQDNFRRSIGLTPFQYIIKTRLLHVHQDLTDGLNDETPISSIARRWGFAHMSDFGQRYRLVYGCTPKATRQNAG